MCQTWDEQRMWHWRVSQPDVLPVTMTMQRVANPKDKKTYWVLVTMSLLPGNAIVWLSIRYSDHSGISTCAIIRWLSGLSQATVEWPCICYIIWNPMSNTHVRNTELQWMVIKYDSGLILMIIFYWLLWLAIPLIQCQAPADQRESAIRKTDVSWGQVTRSVRLSVT